MIFKYVFLFNKDVNIIVDVVDGEPFCQEIFFSYLFNICERNLGCQCFVIVITVPTLVKSSAQKTLHSQDREFYNFAVSQ